MKILDKIRVLENHLVSSKTRINISKMSSWNDYFVKRGISECIDIGEEEKSIFSKLLSFPLTASSALKNINKENIKVVVVGARSEATLPSLFWNEMLTFSDSACSLEVLFVGPQVPSCPKVVNNNASFEYKQSWLHHLAADHTNEKFDLACFFNSGIGSSYEVNNWNHDDKFLDHLRALSHKHLFTSFNRDDYINDSNSFISSFITETEIPNKFRSLWKEKATVNNAAIFNNYASFLIEMN